MPEHKIQYAFKGKIENITKVNIPNMEYQNEHIDVQILYGSSDHVIVKSRFRVYS